MKMPDWIPVAPGHPPTPDAGEPREAKGGEEAFDVWLGHRPTVWGDEPYFRATFLAGFNAGQEARKRDYHDADEFLAAARKLWVHCGLPNRKGFDLLDSCCLLHPVIAKVLAEVAALKARVEELEGLINRRAAAEENVRNRLERDRDALQKRVDQLERILADTEADMMKAVAARDTAERSLAEAREALKELTDYSDVGGVAPGLPHRPNCQWHFDKPHCNCGWLETWETAEGVVRALAASKQGEC